MGTFSVSSSGSGTDVKAASKTAHQHCKDLAETVCDNA
jgi:hypothetical protein